MNKVYSKFRRGDVWYVKLAKESGDDNKDSSVQRKSRPYLIVSCEENNNCAPTINAVPITTRPNDHLPMHVYFNYENRHQLVLCEQITTLSVIDFHRNGSAFMYSFNSDFMEQIDDALSGQLGLRPRVADMKVIENLIEKAAADKEAEMKRKYESNLEAKVSSIANMVAKKLGIELSVQDMLNGTVYRPEELSFVDKAVKAEIEQTAKERTTPPSKSTITTVPPVTTKVDKHVTQKSSKPKRNLDEDFMTAFLEDYKSLSVSEMAAKYDMPKKTVVTYVWMFKKRLGVNNN